jgi:hypothetical protein
LSLRRAGFWAESATEKQNISVVKNSFFML